MNTFYTSVCFSLILVFSLSTAAIAQQTGTERAVQVSATLFDNPPAVLFSWPDDPTASSYWVYRKALDDKSWGSPIAQLPPNDNSFRDEEIEVGVGYEYAFFKKGFDLIRDTVCVPANTELKFTISDMYGIGLCCNFGFGYYQVEACDSLYASGADFAWQDSSVFQVCNDADTCTQLVVTLSPDMFPNSTSWTLENKETGALLGRSGEIGAYLDLRPAYGYIYTGIQLPAIEHRGSLLLLVAENLDAPLTADLIRLELDLISDGWKVIRRTVADTADVPQVKTLIQDLYQQTPDLEALFLLGHIPVPYSGDIYPDTHTEHRGAWAADSYYGDIDGTWTDTIVDRSTAFFSYNHNTPGDGKFDQGGLPSPLELQVGRVDLSNLPAFAADEIELTRAYLQKNHLFRNGGIAAERRALIDDNFGVRFAAPSASGWRNFAPMFGADAIVEADYFSTMREQSYLWSYGCGPGTHISSDGVGSTAEFAADSLRTIFTMLFGSQFGDWDNVNNFLRAPLASGATLTSCWAGNPPWTLHQMAMGYPIGYCARLTQNSENEVYLNGPQLAHAALMGDPSLRMHIVRPVEALLTESTGQSVELRWPASNDPDVIGYYLYRAPTLYSDFQRIHNDLINNTEYTDFTPLDSNNVYLLRAVKLETSASGSYYNLSNGRLDSLIFRRTVSTQDLERSGLRIFPNPAQQQLWLELDRLPAAPLSLELFDAVGRRVLWQPELERSARIRVDLEGLPEGIYFVRVESGSWRETRKIILLK
ncbi:MAG: T9SS type A sorting domain-containing protein [Bacteroidota bacterium]